MVKFDYLDLDSIVLGEGLRKTPGDEASLRELADSIARHGVLQPVLVEPTGEEGKYRLLIGERRFKAARMAGLEKVPAIILDEPLGSEETLETRLIENLHREDIDPLDEAEAYEALREENSSRRGCEKAHTRNYTKTRTNLECRNNLESLCTSDGICAKDKKRGSF